MRRTTKLWIRQIAIAVVAAAAVGYLTLRFTVMPLANHFEREYPHDGQNSLGAAVGALALAVVAAGLTVVGFFIWTLMKTRRIEREENEKRRREASTSEE